MTDQPDYSQREIKNNKIVRITTILINGLVWPVVFLNVYMQKYHVVFAGVVFLMLMNIAWLFYFRNKNFHRWSFISLITYMLISWFIFHEGGVHGAGHLWAFLFPLLAYELKGYKKANPLIFTYYGGLVFIFIVGYSLGVAPSYQTPNFMVVFFVVFLAVTLFLYMYEKRRFETQAKVLLDKNKFEALFNDLTLGVIMLDKDFQILESNKRMKEWFPLLKNNTRSICYDTFHPENKGALCLGCPVKKCFDTKKPQSIEHVKETGAGKKTYRMIANPMLDETGDVYAVIETLEDITEAKKAQQKIEKQNQFFALVAEVSKEFISCTPDNVDQKINNMLERCGQFLQVDRTFLFDFTDDLQFMTNTHEWCADGIDPVKDMVQNYPVKDVPWIAEIIRTKQTLFVPDVDLIPDEHIKDKNELKRQQIQSVLCLPLIKNEKVLGYFGFDSVKKKIPLTDQQMYLLSVLANILGDALQKVESDRQIKEMHERFDQLARQNRILTWEIDNEGLYTFVSPVIKQVLGFEPSEIIGEKHFFDLFPPDSRNQYLDEISKRHKVGKAFTDFVNPLMHKNGDIIWVNTNSIPVYDNKNQLVGYRGLDRDITLQRQMEEAIRYNSSVQEMISRISTLFLSAKNEAMTDKVAKALEITSGFFELDMAGLWVVDERQKVFKLQSHWYNNGVHSLLHEGTQGEFDLNEYQWWHAQVKSGEPLIVHHVNLLPGEALAEKHYFENLGVSSTFCFPFSLSLREKAFIRFDSLIDRADFDWEKISQMQFIVKIISDAYVKDQAQKALEQSEKIARETAERYKAYIRASDSGAWEYYISSGTIWCSYQYFQMLGMGEKNYSPETGFPMAEKLWKELIHPEDYIQAKASFKRYLQNPEGIYEQTFRMRHINGHYIWILSRGTVLLEANGKRSDTFVGTHINITPQKQSEEIIIAKNKELESYLYIASHDLRAPLVNIQGFSNRINKQISKFKALYNVSGIENEHHELLQSIIDQGLPQSLDFIQANVKKMDGLINGLLALSRTGRMKVSVLKVNMNKLFRKITEEYDFQIKEADAEIVINELPWCFGDADLLKQLFSNLIDNALKYRDPQKKLHIAVSGSMTDQWATYKVTDNGIGIEPRLLARIWDVFYRIDPEHNAKGEGIGLNLVAKIAEKNRGSAKANSVVGIGTTFIIQLQRNPFE